MDLTPEEFRRLGRRAVDLIADHLAALPGGPVRIPVPPEVRARLLTPPGRTPLSPDAVLDLVERDVLAHPMGNGNPRFFGWINPPAAPFGILGDLLASGMGPSVAGGDHAATHVEHGVLAWIREVVGFPDDAGAILTSGGSVANLIGLAAMRHASAMGPIRTDGMTAEDPMIVYASVETHSSVQKAVELLGFGSDHLRLLPTDDGHRLDVAALEAAVAADRDAGRRPVAVVASAGTVNSGAIDPIDAVADVCDAEGLWLHVDGSYGAFGVLDERIAPRFAGMERADSIAVDPHKWLSMPVECGCALVQDPELMRDTFSLVPDYLRDDADSPWFSEFGIQQTRAFRALKLWMVLQQIGTVGYAAQIRRDIDLAGRLTDMIEERPDFDLVAAGPLSVVCFRYAPAGVDGVEDLNRRLLPVVQRDGRAFLTGTVLDGEFTLRACIVNFRTTGDDLAVLLDAVREAGDDVRSER